MRNVVKAVYNAIWMSDVFFARQDTILQRISPTVVMNSMVVCLVPTIVISVRSIPPSKRPFVTLVNMDTCYWVQVHVMLVDQRRRHRAASNVIRTRPVRFVLVGWRRMRMAPA